MKYSIEALRTLAAMHGAVSYTPPANDGRMPALPPLGGIWPNFRLWYIRTNVPLAESCIVTPARKSLGGNYGRNSEEEALVDFLTERGVALEEIDG